MAGSSSATQEFLRGRALVTGGNPVEVTPAHWLLLLI